MPKSELTYNMIDSREGLLEREKEIIRLLYVLVDKQLDFIVVGGYAIATYKKRFSVDLDLVIQEKDLNLFEDICKKEGYIAGYDKDISLLYGEKFKRYVKAVKGFKVSIDLLINGLASRSTDATWSFEYIKKHSTSGLLDGLKFVMPERELLIAMKLHSGRLGDMRDVVALMPCDTKNLEKHLLRGDYGKIRRSMERQENFLKKPQFDDSFKGVFGVRVYRPDDVEETKRIISTLLKGFETLQR